MKKIILLTILIISVTSCVQDDQDNINTFFMFPNPYNASSGNATFQIGLNSFTTNTTVTITVKDQAGQLVWTLSQTATATSFTITWSGENLSGNTVVPGIYRVEAKVSGESSGEKTIEILII